MVKSSASDGLEITFWKREIVFTKTMAQNSPKIALALGSGSAKGLAHIGVIQVLEENQIPISAVAGTSAGAFIGALWAAGLSGEEMAHIACSMNWKTTARMFLPTLPKSGLIAGQRIQKFLQTFIEEIEIEDLPMPFACVATELSSGHEVIFNKGNIIPAVRASISIPGIFVPVRHEDRFLVDGGLVNPVPVSVARRWPVDAVIAVNVIPKVEEKAKFLYLKKVRKKRRTVSKKLPEIIQSSLKKLEHKEFSQEILQEKLTNILNRLKEYENPHPTVVPGIFTVMLQSLTIAENTICELRLNQNPPEILLEPNLADVQLLEFYKAERIIQAGREIAERHLLAISNLITQINERITESGA